MRNQISKLQWQREWLRVMNEWRNYVDGWFHEIFLRGSEQFLRVCLIVDSERSRVDNIDWLVLAGLNFVKNEKIEDKNERLEETSHVAFKCVQKWTISIKESRLCLLPLLIVEMSRLSHKSDQSKTLFLEDVANTYSTVTGSQRAKRTRNACINAAAITKTSTFKGPQDQRRVHLFSRG